MPDEHRCIKEAELATVITNQGVLFRATDANKKEIEKLDAQQTTIYDLTKSVAVIAEQITTIRDDVRDVKTDVISMKQEFKKIKEEEVSGLRGELGVWEKYKSHIILMIISSVVAIYLAQILGGF